MASKLLTFPMSLAAVAVAGTAIAAPASAQNRTVTDPVTRDVVQILNEGDCANLQVNQSRTGETSSTLKHLAYDVNSDCTVTVGTGTPGGSVTPDSPNSVGDTEAVSQDSADAGGYTYNWAWSSQTLQDIIFIDISKLKFTNRRGYPSPHLCAGWDGGW